MGDNDLNHYADNSVITILTLNHELIFYRIMFSFVDNDMVYNGKTCFLNVEKSCFIVDHVTFGHKNTLYKYS